jgi:hypothetical protein
VCSGCSWPPAIALDSQDESLTVFVRQSPALTQAILDAIMDAFEAHSTMSKQALDSSQVRGGLKDVLLGPGKLYESLRSKDSFQTEDRL